MAVERLLAPLRPNPFVSSEVETRLRALTSLDFVRDEREQVRFALAVSGGPDSLALLLLAAAAFPGRVVVLTVDHCLRPESADEAAMVADLCARLGVPHRTLKISLEGGGTVQARPRAACYRVMEADCLGAGIPLLMTAHHADDQAETLLMRLVRGSGLGGLAGVRPLRRRQGAITLVRPLLGWRKTDLAALVEGAGLIAADDPSNRSAAYDRTAARRLLASADWLDPLRIAASAAHLAEAEDALRWTADQAWRGRAEVREDMILLDVEDVPAELVRRLVLRAVETLNPAARPDGPSVERLIDASGRRRESTLAGIRVRYGRTWRFAVAPPRRA